MLNVDVDIQFKIQTSISFSQDNIHSVVQKNLKNWKLLCLILL